MNTVHPSPLLKTALWLDAAGSAAVAALQLGLGATLAPMLQLPQALLFETGLFLLAYALTLALMARSERLPVALVRLIIVGNIGWAAAAAALALWLAPSGLGLALLAVHVLAVLLFAGLEREGLNRSAPASRDGRAMAG